MPLEAALGHIKELYTLKLNGQELVAIKKTKDEAANQEGSCKAEVEEKLKQFQAEVKRSERIDLGKTKGWTLLHFSAALGNVEMTNLILEARPELAETFTADDFTALHAAALYGEIDTLNVLMQKQPKLISRTNQEGWTVFHAAAKSGSVEVMEAVYNQNQILLITFMGDGWTPLHTAVVNNKSEATRWLIQKKPELLKAFTKDGLEPINLAAQKQYTEIYRILCLENVLYAAYRGDLDEIKKEENENVLAWVRPDGWTVLHSAVAGEQQKVFEHLLDKNPERVSVSTEQGWTLLHEAAAEGSYALAKLLLDKDPSLLNKKDEDGKLPMRIAAAKGHSDVFKLFLEQSRIEDLDLQNLSALAICQPCRKNSVDSPKIKSSLDYLDLSSSGSEILERPVLEVQLESPDIPLSDAIAEANQPIQSELSQAALELEQEGQENGQISEQDVEAKSEQIHVNIEVKLDQIEKVHPDFQTTIQNIEKNQAELESKVEALRAEVDAKLSALNGSNSLQIGQEVLNLYRLIKPIEKNLKRTAQLNERLEMLFLSDQNQRLHDFYNYLQTRLMGLVLALRVGSSGLFKFTPEAKEHFIELSALTLEAVADLALEKSEVVFEEGLELVSEILPGGKLAVTIGKFALELFTVGGIKILEQQLIHMREHRRAHKAYQATSFFSSDLSTLELEIKIQACGLTELLQQQVKRCSSKGIRQIADEYVFHFTKALFSFKDCQPKQVQDPEECAQHVLPFNISKGRAIELDTSQESSKKVKWYLKDLFSPKVGIRYLHNDRWIRHAAYQEFKRNKKLLSNPSEFGYLTFYNPHQAEGFMQAFDNVMWRALQEDLSLQAYLRPNRPAQIEPIGTEFSSQIIQLQKDVDEIKRELSELKHVCKSVEAFCQTILQTAQQEKWTQDTTHSTPKVSSHASGKKKRSVNQTMPREASRLLQVISKKEPLKDSKREAD